MDGHVAEGLSVRENLSEAEERLKKKTKQPRERNYGVKKCLLLLQKFVIHQHLPYQ
jgi:hypothetical protein